MFSPYGNLTFPHPCLRDRLAFPSGKIFPGFKMLFGSKAFLIRFMTSNPISPNSMAI